MTPLDVAVWALAGGFALVVVGLAVGIAWGIVVAIVKGAKR